MVVGLLVTHVLIAFLRIHSSDASQNTRMFLKNCNSTLVKISKKHFLLEPEKIHFFPSHESLRSPEPVHLLIRKKKTTCRTEKNRLSKRSLLKKLPSSCQQTTVLYLLFKVAKNHFLNSWFFLPPLLKTISGDLCSEAAAAAVLLDVALAVPEVCGEQLELSDLARSPAACPPMLLLREQLGKSQPCASCLEEMTGFLVDCLVFTKEEEATHIL